MERASTRITLDVQKIDSGVQIKAKLGDSARRLVVSLTNRGRPYAPGEGVVAVYYSRKADGVKLFNSAQISGSTVTYDFTGQTANVEGVAECEVRLYDADMNLLTSPRFEMLVDGTVCREGDIPDSSPEYTALTEMVGRGTELIGELENDATGMQATLQAAEAAAQTAASAAASAAEATRHAATYKGQAENSAAASAAGADDAQTQAETAKNYAKRAEAAAERAENALGAIQSCTYTKNEIDTMLGSYVTDIAALVGGDA